MTWIPCFGIPGTEVEIDPPAETASGLTKTCYACRCALLTRDEAAIGGVIGFLSDATLAQIDACLKTSGPTHHGPPRFFAES